MTRLALLFVMIGSAIAVADPSPTSNEPTDAAAGTGAGSGVGSGSGIAAPAPDAPPQKVEQAKEIADRAKLTPIIPNPNNPTKPAYQLYAEIDVPILAVGAVFALARLEKTSLNQPAFCAPLCKDTSAPGGAPLNALDALTKGRYSAGWSTASDFELYGLGAATAAILLSDEGLLNAMNDAVVIGEATLSATAVANIMTLTAGRPRPFLYGTNAPESVRNSADAALSFLSSHTSMAFAMTLSLYIAEKRLHPNTARSKYILAGGLALSTMIAISRVAAGYHFITDTIGGAVVGSSLGILIGSVHGSPVQVVPVVNRDEHTGATSATMGIQGTF